MSNTVLSFRFAACSFSLSSVLTAALPVVLHGQGASAAGAGNGVTPGATTRAALAAAYLRLDKVVANATLDDSTKANVSRAFDGTTLNFFAGKLATALKTMDSITVAVSGKPIAPPAPLPTRLVKGKAPSVARDAFLARLSKLDSTGALAQPIVSARARASLLVDVANAERSAEFLAEPARLAVDVEREVSALERGKNPYAKYAGDMWRSFRGAKGTVVPYRIVASASVANAKTPVPLVFVLHGAGADENAFIDAYSSGLAAKMANERGVLLVSPATIAFAAAPENVDTLLAQLRTEYNVDITRVYVLGHSMGANASARLAQAKPNVFAAAVSLAGGSPVTVTGAPPVLFVGAELDPLIPAKNVKMAADATPTGTYQLLPHQGHTLMVGDGLRLAFPWMLERRK